MPRIKLKKFNPDDVYMFSNGAIADADAMRANFPAIDRFVHVLEISGDTCTAVHSLSSLRARMDIDESLSEDDAIAAIEAIINTPQPVIDEGIDPLERLAAAIEFQNLLNM